MEDVYPKAYKEAYVILNYMPKEDYDRVPKDVITMLEQNMDKEYEYDLDKTIPFEEQKMLKQTKELLAIFFRDYWANEEQKAKIEKKFKEDIARAEEKKKEKYNSNEIFKKETRGTQKIEENTESGENVEEPKDKSLIENNKKKWYNRVFDFIKSIFKKKEQ